MMSAENAPIPTEPKSSGFSTVIAWLIILTSVAFLAWTANYPAEETTENTTSEPQDGTTTARTSAEANELAILKIQSRFLIGVAEQMPGGAAQSLGQLEDIAKTPRGKAAVAIVYAFLDEADDDNQFTTKILDEIQPEQPELATQVRTALKNGVSPTDRESLEKELGWFAELIRPVGPNENSNFGAEIRQESVRTMAIGTTFLSMVLLAFLAGLILLILFFALKPEGALRRKYDASLAAGKKHYFLEAFAVYIGIMALGHVLGTYVNPSISMIAYVVSFVAALLWPKIRGCSWKEARDLIGWNRGTGFFRELVAGFLGYLGIIVIACIGLIITVVLMFVAGLIQGDGFGASGTDSSHPIVGMLDAASTWKGKLFLLFFAAGIAPFLEETMFRGSLFRYFRHHWGFLLSSIIGGVIFAVIHPQGWFAVPALSSMAIGFALLREWRDSLVASMTAHALNNGVIVGLLLLMI